MKVISYKMIAKMDEKVLATYAAYKGYFPNSIILKDSAKAIFESGRTKETSYQKVNKQIKLLKKHGLLTKFGNGLRLASKMEASEPYHDSEYRKFAAINQTDVKQTILQITKNKLNTRLTQIELRKLTKSERLNSSMKKFVKNSKNPSAFTQVSYKALAKYFGINKDTLRRRIQKLYRSGEISIIGAARKRIRRISKLEEPCLAIRQFIYKSWIYEVTPPSFRVNSSDLVDLINGMYENNPQPLDATNT